MTHDGLLVIDKPVDWTSNDVVQKVKRLLGARRVGHTGTLDPSATGVLVLCLNRATKWSAQLMAHDKVYRAHIALGRSTDTGDATGETRDQTAVPELSEAGIETSLSRFRGNVRQQVPLYAAVKVRGKALYRWAREKKNVERPWREITIHRLTLEQWTANSLLIEVCCSKGTYIRALAEDIGQVIGCAAHLASLRRLSVGPYNLSQAINLERLIEEVRVGRFELTQYLVGRDERSNPI